jgi:hypothetical protein
MTISDDFRPDPQLQRIAIQNADLCVKFIQTKFGKDADYSEVFLPHIEHILQLLHLSISAEKPSESDIEHFSAMMGSYLGETFRRNHGGEWGVSEGNTPTLSFGSDYKSFPWIRVYKRLINGEEDNVYDWYHGMIQYTLSGSSSSPSQSPLKQGLPISTQKKGFLSRLFKIK